MFYGEYYECRTCIIIYYCQYVTNFCLQIYVLIYQPLAHGSVDRFEPLKYSLDKTIEVVNEVNLEVMPQLGCSSSTTVEPNVSNEESTNEANLVFYSSLFIIQLLLKFLGIPSLAEYLTNVFLLQFFRNYETCYSLFKH